jgi:hypothetical protein
MSIKIHVANPYDRNFTKESFLLWFGACAPTLVLVYGSLDESIELAGEVLAGNELFGLITPHGSDELAELVAEARDELGPVADESEVYEAATVDLTYTESGYIPSHEWGICIENPTKEQLITCRRERWPYS